MPDMPDTDKDALDHILKEANADAVAPTFEYRCPICGALSCTAPHSQSEIEALKVKLHSTGAPTSQTAPYFDTGRGVEGKKYTVQELLGSREAMDDLLQTRMIAVRDDLMAFINGQDRRIAQVLNQHHQQLIRHVDACVRDAVREQATQIQLLRTYFDECLTEHHRSLYDKLRGRLRAWAAKWK